jgi:hypothetical protein
MIIPDQHKTIEKLPAPYFLVGAGDPEMEAIKTILTSNNMLWGQAVNSNGQPVRPFEAYKACLPNDMPASIQSVILVECELAENEKAKLPQKARIAAICDHHAPGHPGYGRTPIEFMPASSIGQVLILMAQQGWLQKLDDHCKFEPKHEINADTDFVFAPDPRAYDPDVCCWQLAGVPIPETIVFAAAADHCLHAAYRGECPGVDPDALMRWRAETRAAFQKRPVDDILRDVEAARKALRNAAQECKIPHFENTIPELPEAAAREGLPFTAELRERDGRKKIVLQGASPETIRQWMEEMALRGEVYGDPERGFAGVYPKDESESKPERLSDKGPRMS